MGASNGFARYLFIVTGGGFSLACGRVGLPVVEAMAVGVPVIASPVPSLIETDSAAGFIVDPLSVDSMVTVHRDLPSKYDAQDADDSKGASCGGGHDVGESRTPALRSL